MKTSKIDKGKWEKFQKYFIRKNLKMSQNRKLLYDYLLTMPDSLTVTEIYEKTQKHGLQTSLSTVYRSIRLLCEAKLFYSIRLDDGIARYMQSSSQKSTRFVCQRCKRIITAHDNIVKPNIPKAFKNCQIVQTQINHLGLCPRCIDL